MKTYREQKSDIARSIENSKDAELITKSKHKIDDIVFYKGKYFKLLSTRIKNNVMFWDTYMYPVKTWGVKTEDWIVLPEKWVSFTDKQINRLEKCDLEQQDDPMNLQGPI
jgi:hypothetical protein